MTDEVQQQLEKHEEAMFAMSVFACASIAKLGVALVKSGAIPKSVASEIGEIAEQAAGQSGEPYAKHLREYADKLFAAIPSVETFIGKDRRGF